MIALIMVSVHSFNQIHLVNADVKSDFSVPRATRYSPSKPAQTTVKEMDCASMVSVFVPMDGPAQIALHACVVMITSSDRSVTFHLVLIVVMVRVFAWKASVNVGLNGLELIAPSRWNVTKPAHHLAKTTQEAASASTAKAVAQSSARTLRLESTIRLRIWPSKRLLIRTMLTKNLGPQSLVGKLTIYFLISKMVERDY